MKRNILHRRNGAPMAASIRRAHGKKRIILPIIKSVLISGSLQSGDQASKGIVASWHGETYYRHLITHDGGMTSISKWGVMKPI